MDNLRSESAREPSTRGWAFELDTCFTWEELAPLVITTRLPWMPNVATLTVPSGRYVGDHISVSRHVAAVMHAQMEGRGELAHGLDDDVRRRILRAAFAASLHLARAEAAAADAAFWRMGPPFGHQDIKLARAFVDDRVKALREAGDQIQQAIDDLLPVAAPKDGGGQVLAQGAGGKPEVQSLAADAVDQAEAILKGINGIIKELDNPPAKDALADTVKKLAQALAGGSKAAIIGAITDLISTLTKDASAKDIDIDVKEGTVTIFFRIKRNCFIPISFFLDKESVYIRKSTKAGEFTLKTGEKAEKAEDQRENEHSKSGTGGSSKSETF